MGEISHVMDIVQGDFFKLPYHLHPYACDILVCVVVNPLTSSCSQVQAKHDGASQLQTLGVSSFDIPGDPKFPLNPFYEKPGGRGDAGETKCSYQAVYLAPNRQ